MNGMIPPTNVHNDCRKQKIQLLVGVEFSRMDWFFASEIRGMKNRIGMIYPTIPIALFFFRIGCIRFFLFLRSYCHLAFCFRDFFMCFSTGFIIHKSSSLPRGGARRAEGSFTAQNKPPLLSPPWQEGRIYFFKIKKQERSFVNLAPASKINFIGVP